MNTIYFWISCFKLKLILKMFLLKLKLSMAWEGLCKKITIVDIICIPVAIYFIFIFSLMFSHQ